MAWGLFNKIKKGFKKVGSAFKKAAGFVNDKIVKPFKPLIKSAVNSIIPGAGVAVDIGSAATDVITKTDWGAAKDAAKGIANWASNRFGNN